MHKYDKYLFLTIACAFTMYLKCEILENVHDWKWLKIDTL